MQIDVIIPTYNRAHTLERAVESVLSQTYSNFILHIVDDGSTDETEEILEKYQDHEKIKIYYQPNLGVSAARNFAAFCGDSEWISFLDSDDEWLADKLKIQADYIKNHSNCVFVHSEEIWIRNGVRVNPKVKHKKSSDDIFHRSLEFCLISPSTVILKRELFEKHRGFNESFTVCEDYDLWLRILLSETIDFIETPLINKYGGHDDQLSTKFVAMDYWRIKSLIKLYQTPQCNPEQKSAIKETLLKKSELLLKNYQKHNNLEHYNEIRKELSSIMLSVKI